MLFPAQTLRESSDDTQDLVNMDSRTGLDYIVENKDYVSKLGTALESDNYTVKKQVFDLLSALCAYSPEGYKRAFETLEHYMVRVYISLYSILHLNLHPFTIDIFVHIL